MDPGLRRDDEFRQDDEPGLVGRAIALASSEFLYAGESLRVHVTEAKPLHRLSGWRTVPRREMANAPGRL
jgi:hypothetical protein